LLSHLEQKIHHIKLEINSITQTMRPLLWSFKLTFEHGKKPRESKLCIVWDEHYIVNIKLMNKHMRWISE
jgi:hypothetical protein